MSINTSQDIIDDFFKEEAKKIKKANRNDKSSN